MQKCPTCSQRGLSILGVIFMIHDERVTCEKCGTSFTIPKSRKSLVIGLEYTFILVSVAASLMIKNMAPLGVVLLLHRCGLDTLCCRRWLWNINEKLID